jgi:hypothetical protein
MMMTVVEAEEVERECVRRDGGQNSVDLTLLQLKKKKKINRERKGKGGDMET